jgi:hypothetical protein
MTRTRVKIGFKILESLSQEFIGLKKSQAIQFHHCCLGCENCKVYVAQLQALTHWNYVTGPKNMFQ